MAEKWSVTGGMTVRVYDVLVQAVEEGVKVGWTRAHKHIDTPGEDVIKGAIIDNVLSSICAWFNFSEETDA